MKNKLLEQSIFKDIRWNNALSFEFNLDESHFLFDEHFPGFPVVPASLIMELLSHSVAQIRGYETFKVSVNNAKFLNPMVPGLTYRCEFRTKSSETLMFTISDKQSKAYNKGLISLFLSEEVLRVA